MKKLTKSTNKLLTSKRLWRSQSSTRKDTERSLPNTGTHILTGNLLLMKLVCWWEKWLRPLKLKKVWYKRTSIITQKMSLCSIIWSQQNTFWKCWLKAKITRDSQERVKLKKSFKAPRWRSHLSFTKRSSKGERTLHPFQQEFTLITQERYQLRHEP